MYKYIQISLKAKSSITHSERKSYFDSLWGCYMDKKKGSILKFCNAIGFKPVIADICTNYPYIEGPIVKSPDTYISPNMMLYKALWVDLSNKGILKFVIPLGVEEHPNSVYTYDREEISHKFVQFLSKVYPDIDIEVSYLKSFRYTVKSFVLNLFYQSMNFNDIHYTVECSAHRKLTDKEIDQIYKDMANATDYNWHIEQYYCETCKSYHSDCPYHIEVVYDK